jgi:putative heme iron utilization protein
MRQVTALNPRTGEGLDPDEKQRLAALLRTSRWAALATARDNVPLATWVALAPEDDLGGFLLHLSRLALHTRYLETNPRASLSFTEPDRGTGDPQELARVSLQGYIETIGRHSDGFPAARERYLARFPAAAMTFELGDFALLRFVTETARYVPGFGRVHRLGAAELRAAVLAFEGEAS